MKKETQMDILNRDILLLEMRRKDDLRALKDEVQNAFESLKPINLIKNTFKGVTESPDIRDGVGKAAIGMASGFLAKKLLFGFSGNPLTKLAGMAAQAIVTNLAAKNSDKIQESGKDIFNLIKSFITKRREKKEREFNETTFAEHEIYQ